MAIFGDRHISLPADWSKGKLVGILGDADVDATATAGPEASLTIVSVFADTTIRVPAGTRVRHRGLRIFGDRYLQVAAGTGPQLTLTSDRH